MLIDQDLNAELDRLARKRRTSKAALIRQFVRERLQPLPPLHEDPLWRMVGADSYEPVADIDEVIYDGR